MHLLWGPAPEVWAPVDDGTTLTIGPAPCPDEGGKNALLAVVVVAVIAAAVLSALSLAWGLAGVGGSGSKISARCMNYAIIDGDYQIEIYSFEDSLTTVVAEGIIEAGQTIEVAIPIEPGSYQITFTVYLSGYAGVDYDHIGRYGIENMAIEEGKTYAVDLPN